MEYEEQRRELLSELAAGSTNVLRIRSLCRSHPGLIAAAGVRERVWALLLLGSRSSVTRSCSSPESETGSLFEVLRGGEEAPPVGLQHPDQPCEEMQVLEADLKRTRSDMECFRSVDSRRTLRHVLQQFCLTHSVQYKQGMNEVAAPFLFLRILSSSSSDDDTNMTVDGEGLVYVLFEAFVYRFLEHFYCQEASSSLYLFKAFRLFHLLLVYFDPQLGLHLYENDIMPELYAPQWFLCAFARGLPIPLVLRLWDMLISVDDAAFTFFIGLTMLRSKRDVLLQAEPAEIPEIIGSLRIDSDEHNVDHLLEKAWKEYQMAPRCFLRYLRICCVSTPELAPSPPSKVFLVQDNALSPHRTTSSCLRSSSSPQLAKSIDTTLNDSVVTNASSDWHAYFVAMARQSVRRCVLLQASELVSSLAPMDPSLQMRTDTLAINLDESAKQSRSNHFIVIDIRTAEEIVDSGGGEIPTSVRMDPSFLDEKIEWSSHEGNLLDKWLDHFDTMRGFHICIVDMPAAKASSEALWRRLLLGQGDGLAPTLVSYDSSLTYSPHSSYYNHAVVGPSVHTDDDRKDSFRGELNYHDEEVAAATEDQSRLAVKLASILQRHGFPFVSVLDGGFPSLVDHLSTVRGCVEPIVINHNVEKYISFMIASGRYLQGHDSSGAIQSRPDLILHKMGQRAAGAACSKVCRGSIRESTECIQNRDDEDLQLALDVAQRFQHHRMAAKLRSRLHVEEGGGSL